MLRADQITRIAAGIGRAWTLLAGDSVTAVMLSGTSVDLSQSAIPGSIYEITFETEIEDGTITLSVGGASGTTVSESGTYTQEITATADDAIEFEESEDFDGAIISVACSLIQKDLVAIGIDKPLENKFTEGLQVDNAGLMLHEARELSFLSSYLVASGVDINQVDYWLINNARWDFEKDAPIQTALVPIAGIHNITVVSVRKAVETIQSTSSSDVFTFE